MKTAREVRDEFEQKGESISEWAIDNGFAPSLVYRVLTGDSMPKRGKSHDIAVLLGMKNGLASPSRARPKCQSNSESE